MNIPAATTTFLALMRREFWEQKRMVIWPVSIVCIVALGFVICALIIGNTQDFSNHSTAAQAAAWEATMTAEELAQWKEYRANADFVATSMFIHVFSAVCAFIASLVALYYLCGSLYDDRKDRSILFWKSLPTTDLQVVMSKLLTAMILFPAAALIAATITSILSFGVLGLFSVIGSDDFVRVVLSSFALDFTALLKGLGHVIAAATHHALYMIPVFCYLMLISASVRRSPVLFAILPFLVLAMLSPLIVKIRESRQLVGAVLQRLRRPRPEL